MDPIPAIATTDTTPIVETGTGDQALGQDAFLKLLVAQLRYQDPMNPADSQTFLAQTAQFTTVEKLEEIADSMASMSRNDDLATLGTLVGRQVQYRDALGDVAEGTVTAGWVDDDGLILAVADRQVHVNDIVAVVAGEATIQPTPPTQPTQPTPTP